MKAVDYYTYQAKARGLQSVADVLAIVRENKNLYDNALKHWLPTDRKATIYEVACGPGVFLHWLQGQGFRNVRGSDSSSAQIALALEGGLPVIEADSLRELRQMPPGSIDCLVALDFYEHLSKDDMLAFFSEAHRVLGTNGILLLRGPNGDSPVVGRALYNDITHQWALSTTAFRACLEMVGFHDVAFTDDTIPGFAKGRYWKVPLSWASQRVIRFLLKAATREDIRCLSASMFIRAVK